MFSELQNEKPNLFHLIVFKRGPVSRINRFWTYEDNIFFKIIFSFLIYHYECWDVNEMWTRELQNANIHRFKLLFGLALFAIIAQATCCRWKFWSFRVDNFDLTIAAIHVWKRYWVSQKSFAFNDKKDLGYFLDVGYFGLWHFGCAQFVQSHFYLLRKKSKGKLKSVWFSLTETSCTMESFWMLWNTLTPIRFRKNWIIFQYFLFLE